MPPGHAVGAGENAGDGAHDRYELGDDDDGAAVLEEQILTELNAPFGDADIGPEPQQQPIAELRADQVADHTADQRRHEGDDDDRDDVEFVRAPGDDRANDERGFAWQRNANAFEADKACDNEQSINMDEMGDVMHRVGTRTALTYTYFYAMRTP